MTDHERLVIALLSEDDDGRRAVTVEEVVTMLYELGAERRYRAYEGLLLVSA